MNHVIHVAAEIALVALGLLIMCIFASAVGRWVAGAGPRQSPSVPAPMQRLRAVDPARCCGEPALYDQEDLVLVAEVEAYLREVTS